jgi:hypothetical protein
LKKFFSLLEGLIIKHTKSNYIAKYNKYHILPKDESFWTLHDFTINDQFHRRQFNSNLSVVNEIRLDLIKDLGGVLNEFGVQWFVFGKTLVSVQSNSLPYDHDDDIAVQGCKFLKSFSSIKKSLNRLGFCQIRFTKEIVSFYRDSRYVDICLFSKKNSDYYVHFLKKYKGKFLFPTREVVYKNTKMNLPCLPEQVIYNKYHSVINKIRFQVARFKINNILNSIRVVDLYIRLLIRLKHHNRLLLNFFIGRLLGIKYKCINLNTFLKLDIEEKNSFNRRWRKKHLDMVTSNGKYWRLDQIYNYFNQNDVINSKQREIVETMLSEYTNICKPSLSNFFWSSGNNFFFYCVKYGFVKDVVPYSKIDAYIRKIKKPMLYSGEYYSSLDSMSEKEINIFLKSHPLEIGNKSITGGRHRALAIIGSLLKGCKINKIWVVERESDS